MGTGTVDYNDPANKLWLELRNGGLRAEELCKWRELTVPAFYRTVKHVRAHLVEAKKAIDDLELLAMAGKEPE